MKKNNWKYWILLKIKHGIIGKILIKHFNYVFPLSKEEVCYKYPYLEEKYREKLKSKFGEDTEVVFEYSKGKNKTDVDIFYNIKNEIKKKYGSICILPNIFFNIKKPTKECMKYMREKYKKTISD